MRGGSDTELPIIQYWHSRDLPPDVAELIDSFRSLNPDLQHVLFCEAGARRFIAEQFTDREIAAFDACAVPAMQADYLRYCAAYALGGVYADVGFRCVRPLSPLLEEGPGGLLFRRPQANVIPGFFLFSRREHPLPRLALDLATANIERRAVEKVSVVTGPWVFSSLAALHHAGSGEALRRRTNHSESGGLLEHLLAVVGEGNRLEEAFHDVQITSLHHAMRWIDRPATRLEHKGGRHDWINWPRTQGTIFRDTRRERKCR